MTPITGSGLPKVGSKKNSSAKAKSLKRKSSDLTLREVRGFFCNKIGIVSCAAMETEFSFL